MSFFEDVRDILKEEQNNILGSPLREAAEGVQEIVRQLMKRGGLPEKIASKYTEFGEYESLLYSSESYRDHFFHPFHTFLLGFLMLYKLRLQLSQSQWNKSPFPLDDNFLKKWLLVSLWHDITYAAEKGPRWLEGFIKDKLGVNIRADQDWGPILSNEDNIDALVTLSFKFENNHKQRQRTFRAWLNKQIEKHHDHGVLSAILLLNEAEKLRKANEWNQPKDKDMVDECGLAIALHNYHISLSGDNEQIKKEELEPGESLSCKLNQYGKLNIQDYPLAYLLAYCDTAQEWGRPSSRRPVNYIDYEEVSVSTDPQKEKEINICIKYDVEKYTEMLNKKEKKKKKNGASTNSIPIDSSKAIEKLLKEETQIQRIKSLSEAWRHSEWKFKIPIEPYNVKLRAST